MTLAIILVIAAALASGLHFSRRAFSQSLQVSGDNGLAGKIQPSTLKPSAISSILRKTSTCAADCQRLSFARSGGALARHGCLCEVAGRNAAVLVRMGQALCC